MMQGKAKEVEIVTGKLENEHLGDYLLWQGDVIGFLDQLPSEAEIDLIVTSPPYNIGKEYEEKLTPKEYLNWQRNIIEKSSHFLKNTGSICWQVGNFVENGTIWPWDIELAPIFRELGFQLRNRIIWRYGHGLHSKRRFSGRYEVVLWFTRTDDYTFNLDPVRIPAKYPGKKYSKGPKAGEYSGNPKGKNPEDVWQIMESVWDIPNVKSNHIEKTSHPCQFPVGLVERLILSMTNRGDLVFDPLAGVASAGVAAALHERRFWGSDISLEYLEIGQTRIQDALAGKARYRPYNRPIYDPGKSKLSKKPEDFK